MEKKMAGFSPENHDYESTNLRVFLSSTYMDDTHVNLTTSIHELPESMTFHKHTYKLK